MNLRKKFTSIAATSAILLSLTAGAAFAQPADSDEDQTYLNMICPETSSVEITVGDDFTVNAADGVSGTVLGVPYYNSDTLTDNFEVVMNLTCNWSDDFQVRGEIGPFVHDGAIAPAPGTLTTFGGSHLYLSNGDGVYVGPNVVGVTGEPEVQPVVFPTILSTEGEMISNGDFWFLDFAAPGITTAHWDGQLRFLPVNLADGMFEADLTVELTVQ